LKDDDELLLFVEVEVLCRFSFFLGFSGTSSLELAFFCTRRLDGIFLMLFKNYGMSFSPRCGEYRGRSVVFPSA